MHQCRKPVPSHRHPPSSFISPTYSHVSTYRFVQMELQLYSPSITLPGGLTDNKLGPLPVFGEHDQVRGKVTLARSCYHTGCLSISIEGAFMYSPLQVNRDDAVAEYSGNTKRIKHVFFSSSTVLTISPGSDSEPSRYPFRHAFSRRRPSISSLESNVTATERSFSFAFDLPSGCRPWEEMPPSFTGSMYPVSSQSFDVTYKVIVRKSPNASDSNSFEVPILFCPDTGFRSAEAILHPQSWLEMPLTSDRPVPLRCAVTLPASVTFSRTSSIPYFAIFQTIPQSADLAKEIASDATISVSLLRQITVIEGASPPPSPPSIPDKLNTSHSPRHVSRHEHSRTAKPVKRLNDNSDFREKSLARLPTRTVFSESLSVQHTICIGFPKRPRPQTRNPGGHPSLNSQLSLPDGLHKAEIQLHEGMLPCIDWAGVSVKYYLDASVLVGQDSLRARIPIRIV
ncbi:hypothetical protein L208DRAFT_1331020 [Tricholoma matsutake]|nr:hypothetical protein L208DRAFT_1331020 [Tricholoma matsutake 945]